jgi:hypothetical protein
MALFDTLPIELFRPLAAQNAHLYGELLLTIFEEVRRHSQPLSRELVIDIIYDVLRQHPDTALDDFELELNENEEDPLLQRAHQILRYFISCKWFRNEIQRDFSQYLILPDYAFRLLQVLDDLNRNESVPFQGLIYSIYSMLQKSLQEKSNAHLSLPQAYSQMNALKLGLQELQHNIGVHIERVLKQLEAKQVLDQLFSTYRNEIMDRAYHQLRTTDHVSRFRPGILEALTQFNTPEQLHEIALALQSGSWQAGNVEQIEQQLASQIAAIREHFLGLDALLEEIDIRHSQFVDSAVRTIELQLTANSTTSGKLNAVLETVLHTKDPQLDELLNEHIQLFEFFLLDSASLSAPSRAAQHFEPSVEETQELSDEDIAELQAQTLRQLQRNMSRERIRAFALSLLGDQSEIAASEIAPDVLPGPDDLAMLIYLRQYGDGSLGYCVEPIADAPLVERGEIGFRDFVLRKV